MRDEANGHDVAGAAPQQMRERCAGGPNRGQEVQRQGRDPVLISDRQESANAATDRADIVDTDVQAAMHRHRGTARPIP